MPIRWGPDDSGQGPPQQHQQQQHHSGGGGGWGNVRLKLGTEDAHDDVPNLSHGPASNPQPRRSVGFRPFSAKAKEILHLGPEPEPDEPPKAPAQGANDWKTFVAAWMADDEEVPVDGPNGRVTFHANSNLAELAGDVQHHPQQHHAAGPTDYGHLSMRAKSAIRKPAIRGVSALPSKRAKSAFRKPGAGGSRPESSVKDVPSRGQSEGEEEGPVDRGIMKKSKKKKDRDKKNPFRMPALHTFSFEHLVHNIVWRVGRNFGFQAFNINPATKDRGYNAEWTPATIFVASDHLVALLVKNYFIRRDKGDDERQEERFAKAVFELHTTIFYSYEEQWTHMHGLSIRPQVMQDVLDKNRFCDESVVCGMLTELALYFLIYTESSSMRHSPELLWFLYWCFNHSYVMQDLWNRDPPENFPNIREVRIGLRNKYQQVIRELQSVLGIYPDRIRPEDCGRLGPIMTRLKGTDVPDDQRIIAADLIAFGDGNFYHERIVTPIFYVISYEIDHLSNLGVDVAHRLGYDDINESMAHTGIVRLALRDLRVRGDQILHGSVNDAYQTMTNLGYARGKVETNFDPQVAADWWRSNVFVKTYRERRTWMAVFRAYYRVYAAHLVLYHGMQAQAFVGWNWRIISSCLITHAFCTALERLANWYMTRHPAEPLQTALSKVFDKKGHFKISRRANAQALAAARAQGFGESKAIGLDKSRMQPVRVVEIEGSPYLGVLGFVEWIMLAFFMLGWYVLQYFDGPFRDFCYDYWPYFAAGYSGAFLLHFLLTTRDGYVISLTHTLNLPALFKASSSRPDPVNWMQGRMRMKYKLFFLNALFWIIVFAMKIPFDYYIICQPSVLPLQLTFNVDWLECPKDSPKYWGIFPCIGGDWVLAFVRLAPFVIIVLLDTSLFYQVTTTIFGVFRGLFKLDLGVLTAWEEVVKEFYKAPYRWWFKCMSETGNRNQLTLLKMMLFDNAADPETGAIMSDGRMFKKAVLTPEEIMGAKKRSVNVAAVLDGDDDDDSAAAANGQGPKGPRGGKGGAGGQGGKEGEDKPLSSGWKLALQNFGLKGGQTAEQKAAAAKQAPKPAPKASGPKVGPKGGPLLPTSTNMKHMQKQLNQMQRLPMKLPMTTITERMMATTEKPGAGGDDANKPMLASVAEKILGNKHAAQAAAQLKEMTPEEKRREIVSRIQAAQRARQGDGGEGASAGLPSADAGAFGGGSAAVMVNASDSPPAKGGWGRAAQALARRKVQEAEGAEAQSKPGVPHRDRLTSETNVEMARPDEEEDLRPFSAGTAVTMGAESRKSLAVGRARSHAALEDIEDDEDDKDKPASAGSAATVETLERAGVLAPGGGQDQRAVTPTLLANPRMAGLGSAGGPPGSAGSQRDGAASRDTLREQWNARKARMMADPFQARRMESGVGALQAGDAGPSGSQPHEQPEWPSLMQRDSMAAGRASVSGAPGLNASPSFAQPAEAPPRYSWTGAPSDADALGRTLSSNRQAVEAARGGVVTPPRASRLGNPRATDDPTRLSDLGEYLGPAGQAALADGADDDDGLGVYQGYNTVFDNGGGAQGEPGQMGDGQGQQLGGAGAGSGGRGRAGPVAESVVDRVSGGMEDAAVNWVKLQQSGVGPAAASAPLWIPRDVADSDDDDDVDGDLDVASWWERRVRASEARVAGAGEEQEARMSSLTAFRADGDPLAVAYEWRVEDPAGGPGSSDNEPAVLPGRVVAERQLSLRYIGARTRAALARGDSSRSSASAALSGGLPGSTTNGDSSWLAVVDAASASHVKAGPVAEAGERDSNEYGTEHADLDPSERRRAQAAGIDPVLMRGLSKKNREPEPGAGGGPTVVRSISGTSLHSTFFKDTNQHDDDNESIHMAPPPASHAPPPPPLLKVASHAHDDTSSPTPKGGNRRRAVAFGGEEVEEYDINSPAGQIGVQHVPEARGGPGASSGHGSQRHSAAPHRPTTATTEDGGIMSRWIAGLSGWTGLSGANKVQPNDEDAEDEEAAVRAARQMNGGGSQHGQKSMRGGRPTTASSRPTTAGQGRATSALPRSNTFRTRPTTALRQTGDSHRPTTALRPTTAMRPTTARPMTALLRADPVKEAKRKEKRDREAAIERAAGGLVRSNSLIILDGADPDEDEEIDEVHAQMMMWNAFAFAWDEVVDDLRQADYINDKEVSMLKFVRLDMGSRGHGLRPILLPTFFYAGQVRKVVDTGQVSTAQIMVLNELRVLCVWLGCQVGLLSGKHAHVITSAPFHRGNVNVKHALLRKKMLSHGLKMVEQLETICERHEVPFDMKEIADNLYQLWVGLEGECFAIHKAAERKKASPEEVELASILFEVVTDMKHVISSDPEGLKAVMKAALLNNATADYRELLRVIRVIKRMLVTTEAEATPQSEEAQRVLGFFINSLGHPSLDKPPSIDKMWSWSILTPLYEEDVLYALDTKALAKELGLKMKKMTDLLSETDDSISLMSYLKAMFPYEWSNFKERMKTINPDVSIKDLSEHDFAPGMEMYEFKLELQMWASLRGQLLARTVHGMMLNETALRVLARLEHPMPPTMSELEYKRYIDQLCNSKFEYVVTPQTYGKNRVSKDLRMRWLAQSIDILMRKYPRLKVAFLDQAELGGGQVQYSVMARGRDMNDPAQLAALAAMGINDDDSDIIEVYRVRLPHNKYSGRGVIIGEGKPENQNHAVIFAFGEGLQAIDMNQDNVLAETLKGRNLVTELLPSTKGAFHLFADDDEEVQITRKTIASELIYVMRMRQVACTFTALVGFREWIFSEKSGALGRFAAATEYAFGTISQRTLTHPARIRLHYGHPDLFNKMFVMTRGGISKATRQLHLTEDVFCGCNHTLRGGRIRYKEYISCGKGRDMGFDSINGFNFKIAGGGGEWAISRESSRLGSRLDFFRLMMFYHSCIGFYINSWFTTQAAFWNIYALLVFNMAQASEMNEMLKRIYNVQQVLQLGTLAMIPYIGQLILEIGVVKAFVTVMQQILTGSLFFYMFQQQTVGSSFIIDMFYGSAKYVGTGRGFNITALDFVKVFTLYNRSHLYYAFELLSMLTTLYIVKGCAECNYGSITWSGWLLAFVLIFAPLWFNPFSFDIAKVKTNFLAWQRWMHGDVDPLTGSNWYTWNNSMLEKMRNDGGNNTDEWVNVMVVFVGCLPYILLAIAAASRLDIVMPAAVNATNGVLRSQIIVFIIATLAIWIVVHITIQVRTYFTELADHKPYRIYRYTLTLLAFIFLIVWLAVVSRWYDGNGFTTLCVILYANFQLLIAYHKFVTVAFSQNNAMRAFVDSFYYTIDQIIGYIMFILIALLSFLGVVGVLQMKILFNDAFAQTAGHARIARAMKDNKVGFDTRSGPKGRRGGRAGGDGASAGAASVAAPSTVGGASSNWEVRSIVTSEHRYM